MNDLKHLAGSTFRFLSRFLQCIQLLLVYPAVLLYSVVKGKKYYFSRIAATNIGGFAQSVDAFLRRTSNNHENIEYIFLVQGQKVANEYFYGLVKRKLHILENPILKRVLLPMVVTNNPLNVTLSMTYLRADELEKYPRISWFDEYDHLRGKELLNQLGISGDAWYVCFFARDNAFGRTHYSSQEASAVESFHSCRNSDIDTYIKAMQFILDQGGYVIRIGNIVEKPVALKHPRLIDYPFSQYKSDFADIYIPCHCKFIVGNASGIVDLTWIVDKPYGRVNEPIYALKWPRPDLIFIPKFIKDKENGKCLTIDEFNELFDINRVNDFYALMKQRNLVYVNNSEEDILQVTQAMYRLYVLGEHGSADRPKVGIMDGKHTGYIWPPFLTSHPELIRQ